MKHLWTGILVLGMITGTVGQDLEGHRWKDRVLLLYTPGVAHPEYLEQVGMLQQDLTGLQERKLVVYTRLKDRYGCGLPVEVWREIEGDRSPKAHFKSGFGLELIGLDGSLKLRREGIVSAGTLWNLIDGMPMRRAQMRKNKN